MVSCNKKMQKMLQHKTTELKMSNFNWDKIYIQRYVFYVWGENRFIWNINVSYAMTYTTGNTFSVTKTMVIYSIMTSVKISFRCSRQSHSYYISIKSNFSWILLLGNVWLIQFSTNCTCQMILSTSRYLIIKLELSRIIVFTV